MTTETIDILASLEDQRANYSKLCNETERLSKVLRGRPLGNEMDEQLKIIKSALANLDVAIAMARKQK